MIPDPKQYHKGNVGPLTYLNAVRSISGMELPWKDICHRYMDGTTASACAKENMESDAQLMCEAWDFLERMPEPTDMPRQAERESLLIRFRAWGRDLQY